MLTPIPLPADDYDRTHSTYAALSSLHAAATSLDAAMDSLVQTVELQHRRVHLLEIRARRCREFISKLNELVESKGTKEGDVSENYSVDDAICTVFSPGMYEEALCCIEMKIEGVKDDLSGNRNQNTTSLSSASDATRAAADAAVRQALILDAQTDDGEAVPSDMWLDMASVSVNLGRSIKATETQRHVPLLLGALSSSSGLCMEEKEYGAILDSLAFSTSMNYSPTRLGYTYNSPGDDESVHSATSKMSALTMTSTAMSPSGRLTAGQRRRWHQQQQQMRNIKAGVATAQPLEKLESSQIDLGEKKGSSNYPEAIPSSPSQSNPRNLCFNISTMRGRQQSVSGSHPYLCEVLHDSYGIGTEPKRGLVDCSGFSARGSREGGTEFSPQLSCIQDLTIFNSSRQSYGLANRRAGAAAVRQKQQIS